MLHENNSYIRSLKRAQDFVFQDCESYKVVIDAEKRLSRQHGRRYNVPSCNEVAVLLVGEQNGKRDIVLRTRNNTLRKISETHRSYDPLQYPILFPRGEDGFTLAPRLPVGGKFTAIKFYAYRLMVRRRPDFNTLLRCRRAMQQYVVDMYVKTEISSDTIRKNYELRRIRILLMLYSPTTLIPATLDKSSTTFLL